MIKFFGPLALAFALILAVSCSDNKPLTAGGKQGTTTSTDNSNVPAPVPGKSGDVQPPAVDPNAPMLTLADLKGTWKTKCVDHIAGMSPHITVYSFDEEGRGLWKRYFYNATPCNLANYDHMKITPAYSAELIRKSSRDGFDEINYTYDNGVVEYNIIRVSSNGVFMYDGNIWTADSNGEVQDGSSEELRPNRADQRYEFVKQ